MAGLKRPGWAMSLAALAGLLGTVGAARAASICVATTGELQAALAAAASNGQDDTIQLVQGTYGGQSWHSTNETFNLTLEGGYGAGCGFRVADPANTVLDGGGTGYVLALTATVKADFTLDALTLRNGRQIGTNGGGLYVATVLGGSVTLTEIVLLGNSAVSSDGGGAYVYSPGGDGGAVTLNGCDFVGNSARTGGGVYITGFAGTVTVSSSTFSGNETTGSDGGGLYLFEASAVSVAGSAFEDNTAFNMGGGARISCASGTFAGNRFHGNAAAYGAGLALTTSGSAATAAISGNTFDANHASSQGGGIWAAWSGTLQLANNLLHGGTSGKGGGVYVSSAHTLAVSGNTVAGNSASTDGGGLWVQLYDNSDRADLLNSVFWANAAGAGDDLWVDNDANNDFVPSAVTFEYNDFDQSAGGTYQELPLAFSATNLDKVDPLFVDGDDPTAPDFHLQSVAGSYHGGAWLADPCHSPLVDAGNPGSPYGNEPAPNGGRVDLGAHGNTLQASLSVSPATPPPCLARPAGLAVDTVAGVTMTTNLNGVLEPGETAVVAPSWRNVSAGEVGLTGVASDLTGPLVGTTYTEADVAASYGTVAAGAAASCNDTPNCYELGVGLTGARAQTHWDATFLETLSSGQPRRWTLHVGSSFSDVPGSMALYSYVEALLHSGTTTGCTTATYCPTNKVPRSQMAVFIARAMLGGDDAAVPAFGTVAGKGAYSCGTGPGGVSVFPDVSPAASYCRHVHHIASQAVSLGCGTGDKYCPSTLVPRSQMAMFIARAVAGGEAAVPDHDTVGTRTYDCRVGSAALYFSDVVAGSSYCKHAHYLWAHGMIDGCATVPLPRYCPTNLVRRDQMAKFLVNGFGFALYGP